MAWLGVRTLTLLDYYNVEDFNRIETNIAFLNEALQTNIVRTYDINTTLTIPTVAYLNQIEESIELIANSCYIPGGWSKKREWKHGDAFNYSDANRIENKLKLLYELFQAISKSYCYCGAAICGSELNV